MVRSAKRVGRIAGMLLLTQIVVAILSAFVLLERAYHPPGFLANAAGMAVQVRTAVMLWFLAGALTLVVAIVTLPVFRAYSERAALLYLALSVVGCMTVSVDNVGVLTMLSLSEAYAKAGASSDVLQTLFETARSARNAAHFTGILVGGITGFVFNSILWRFALIPRALGAVGMGAVLIQMTAVTMPLLGFRFQTLLLVPAALVQSAVVLWLIAKGFEERT